MCTVTFIPGTAGPVITSSRDEKRTRGKALPPALYTHAGNTLLFPKDRDRGGSWIIAKPNGDTGVLLNGAFVSHQPKPFYGQSRGIVLLQMMQQANPLHAFKQTALEEIEPFTVVLYSNGRLHECRWTGEEKAVQELDVAQKHIWSSATLYCPDTDRKRKAWFHNWKGERQPAQTAAIAFHTTAGDGDAATDVLMARPCGMRTVSITSVAIHNDGATMLYKDVIADKTYRNHLSRNQAQSGLQHWWKRFYIKLGHWEYWPFSVVYTPVYFYWAWLTIKARSPLFFSTSNPGIRNAGFLMESKKEIYDLLPKGTYPTTVLLHPAQPFDDVQQTMEDAGLHFPLIAKPDTGLRGMAVRLLHNKKDLEHYHRHSAVDYLLQAFVPYTKEAGIFYYRMPGQQRGCITGITVKTLLTVKGDGHSTIEELLQGDNRFLLQLDALKKSSDITLSEVLAEGEERIIVPFGNHCRGAKFTDGTALLTPELYNTIDRICRNTEGFYFGRLDIKYDNWEDLCRGKKFSIIEVNGAGSEPTHIYDPAHSIFFAWKEIRKHLAILYRISMESKKKSGLRFMPVREGLRMFRENKAHVAKLAAQPL